MIGFNDAYEGTPPWDIGRPQGAFRAIADAGALHGRVLDAVVERVTLQVSSGGKWRTAIRTHTRLNSKSQGRWGSGMEARR
jgi:hypothetical protein